VLRTRVLWDRRRRIAIVAIVGITLPLLLLASLVAWLVVLRVIWTAFDGPPPAGQLASGPQATIVFDRADRPVFSFGAEQRIDVALDEVSPHLVAAVIAAEDRRFFQHRGLDPVRIAGAAWRNSRAGRITQGGSTITQQLVRAMYLGHERTWRRKIREALIATDLEARLSKRQILELYLNTIYFGDGFYGVEAAARGYFGQRARDLGPEQAALLAALVRSPARSPSAAPATALARRNLVLRLMHRAGTLPEPDYRAALARPLSVRPRTHAGFALTEHLEPGPPNQDPVEPRTSHLEPRTSSGLYFHEAVRLQLVALFGDERVLRDGLRVYTTLDPDQQREAERAIRERIAKLGAKRKLLREELQGALVSLDPRTGEVRALVGGRDFDRSRFNRAVQARRQPGSAFKPIVFAAALERGYGPGSLLRELSTPILAAEGDWLPNGEHEEEEYTLRRALRVSSNRASAQLMQLVGVRPVIDFAHKLGIESDLPAVPSLALGTGGVTLLELVSAYGAFANNGLWVRPTLIRRVEDRHGALVWQTPHDVRQAVSASTAFLMSSMLRDVIAGGTGHLARSMGFRQPAAGKTGTTNDYADAWFVGYTPRLATGVWFGFDRPRTIFKGGFAGVVAVPAWTQFMMKATAGDAGDWYKTPTDVARVEICRDSGELATMQCRRASQPPSPDGFGGPRWSVVGGPLATPGAQPAPQPPPPIAGSGVYHDLFAVGTGPSERCRMHEG
jgi:1A family penicillin-binding protein